LADGWEAGRRGLPKDGETPKRLRLGGCAGAEECPGPWSGCAMNLAGSNGENRSPSRRGERRRIWGRRNGSAVGCGYGDRAFSNSE
jgi:hypothetical protein